MRDASKMRRNLASQIPFCIKIFAEFNSIVFLKYQQTIEMKTVNMYEIDLINECDHLKGHVYGNSAVQQGGAKVREQK